MQQPVWKSRVLGAAANRCTLHMTCLSAETWIGFHSERCDARFHAGGSATAEEPHPAAVPRGRLHEAEVPGVDGGRPSVRQARGTGNRKGAPSRALSQIEKIEIAVLRIDVQQMSALPIAAGRPAGATSSFRSCLHLQCRILLHHACQMAAVSADTGSLVCRTTTAHRRHRRRRRSRRSGSSPARAETPTRAGRKFDGASCSCGGGSGRQETSCVSTAGL